MDHRKAGEQGEGKDSWNFARIPRILEKTSEGFLLAVFIKLYYTLFRKVTTAPALLKRIPSFLVQITSNYVNIIFLWFNILLSKICHKFFV